MKKMIGIIVILAMVLGFSNVGLADYDSMVKDCKKSINILEERGFLVIEDSWFNDDAVVYIDRVLVKDLVRIKVLLDVS